VFTYTHNQIEELSVSPSGRVEIREDVVFGTGGGRDLKCDVYIPPGASTLAPAILLVHGGAWVVGDKSQLRGYGFLLGREGIVCVAGEYRLAGESSWPAQIHDVKAAIRWMRANAEALGIDPNRIAICGASSGAHLALIAAGTPNLAELEGDGGHAGVSSAIAAAISFYAPTTLEPGSEMLADSVAKLLGEEPDVSVFKQASPTTYIAADFPPTMLMHSNQDELIPAEQSIDFATALHAVNVPAELHVFDKVPHMFDGDKRLGRQAAVMVQSFIERYLPENGVQE
jgi:acetyl esterase/lipase